MEKLSKNNSFGKSQKTAPSAVAGHEVWERSYGNTEIFAIFDQNNIMKVFQLACTKLKIF